jgi:hypothetical protein
MYFFGGYILYIILGVDFLSFHLTFWKTHKIDFWHKASSTIVVTFQMIMFFQQNFMYSHIYVYLNEKIIQMQNFSYRIEIGQWTHIQYIIEYFTTKIPIFFTRNFGQKTHFGQVWKKKFNHFGQVILNLSIVTKSCIFLLALSWHFWLVNTIVKL